MEDEVDIRAQILTVLRSWKLILGLAVLAAGAAAAYAWSLPTTYEAEALVSLTQGRIFFDLSGVSQAGVGSPQAYIELAESNAVVQAVFEAAGPELLGQSIRSPNRLRGKLEAVAAAGAPLLRLQVTDTDPERAAALANLWAEAFSALAGELYGQDQANLALYEEALVEAETALDEANAALNAFQTTNRLSILQAQLNSQQASLSDFLNRRREAGLLHQDTEDLLVRLDGLPANTPASLADDLALLALTTRVYGGQLAGTAGGLGGGSDAVLQIQMTGEEPFMNATVGDQRRMAEGLLSILDTRRTALGQLATEVEPQILDLQGQIAQVRTDEQRLAGARDLAAQLYSSRSVQVKEAGLAVRQAGNAAQVAGQAVAPLSASGPARFNYVALGAALGGVLGVGLALAREFVRPAAERAAAAPKPKPAPARSS